MKLDAQQLIDMFGMSRSTLDHDEELTYGENPKILYEETTCRPYSVKRITPPLRKRSFLVIALHTDGQWADEELGRKLAARATNRGGIERGFLQGGQ